MTNKLGILRFPLLATAFGLLLVALWAGLLRLGWAMPHADMDIAAAHGPLMIAGFLGTLISIERAVAVSLYIKSPLLRQLPYLAPLFSASGALSLILHLDPSPAPFLITLSSITLVFVFTFIVFKQPEFFNFLMGLGAVSWLLGNVRWYADQPLYAVVPWWIGFLVLTIIAERLELARIRRISRDGWTFFAIFMGGLLIGLLTTWRNGEFGNRLMGLSEIGLALWLLRYDIARRTIRKSDLTRYMAACLLMGYVWLGISGGLSLVYGDAVAGYYYDAMLHTVFLGFAFSMIFAHAPIILPSILGVSLVYHPVFYVHFALLQLSLAMRVIGDIALWVDVRRWGGLLNAAVILLFMGINVWAVVRARLAARRVESTPKTRLVLPVGISLFGISLIVIALFGVSDHPPSQNETSSPAEVIPFSIEVDKDGVEAGQHLFQSTCAMCHGMDGRGLPGVGPNLIESDFVSQQTDETLLAFVIRGRQAWEPDNKTGIAMPPRGGNPTLSDTDILHIIAYLRSSQP